MATGHIFIDLGSSSIKTYRYANKKLELIFTKSLAFKDGFTPEGGISIDNQNSLIEIINQIKYQNPQSQFHLYGTAIYRKFSEPAKKNLSTKLHTKTGLDFRIISQDEENIYLEHALIDKFKTPQPLLLLNIGGGSTELTVVQGGQTIERHNIDLGVGSINSHFPEINSQFSQPSLSEVSSFIGDQLPQLKSSPKIVFYTGGELNYMRLSGYHLVANKLFTDSDHPSTISLFDFQARNQEIFTAVSLEDLEKLMPDNPKWMHGARSCSCFAQTICEKYGVDTIIPSDSNLINGIIRKDFS